MLSAEKFYNKIKNDNVAAFSVVDPDTRENARKCHANAFYKSYVFRDGSRVKVYNKASKSHRWAVSWGCPDFMWAVCCIGKI